MAAPGHVLSPEKRIAVIEKFLKKMTRLEASTADGHEIGLQIAHNAFAFNTDALSEAVGNLQAQVAEMREPKARPRG